MPGIEIRDMQADDEYFVGTCSHVNESAEVDASGERRCAWLRGMHDRGLRVKVALESGKAVAFAYCMPIEISPWGPIGDDLMVMNCLWVPPDVKGRSIGTRLVEAVEEEARRQGHKGLVTGAQYTDFWFMPARYFERLGFTAVARRGDSALLWKRFDDSARPPAMLERNYTFRPVEGKVVVDLFHHTFCQTVAIEAQRVKEVCAEFGDRVILNEYCADDPAILRRYQLIRGIFVNGKKICWGYEAPREGIREAIEAAAG